MAAADDRGRVQVGLGLAADVARGAATRPSRCSPPASRCCAPSGSALDLATALNWHGTLAMFNGNHARAEVMFSEALVLAEAAGDQPGAINSKASALANLGMVALRRGDCALAETRLAEALRLRDAHGFDLAAAVSVEGLAAVAYARGDYHLAIERYRESLVRFGERGELNHVASAVAGVACSAAALGHTGAAARLFGAVAGGPRAGGDARVRTGLAGHGRSPPRRRAGRPRRGGVRNRLGRRAAPSPGPR